MVYGGLAQTCICWGRAAQAALPQLGERIVNESTTVVEGVAHMVAGAHQRGLQHPALLAVPHVHIAWHVEQRRDYGALRREAVGVVAVGSLPGPRPPHHTPY